MMDATIKKRWVEELRSGRWRKIIGQLSDLDTGRCVLGVLCEIAVKDGIIEPTRPLLWDTCIIAWAGLPDGDPVISGGPVCPEGEPEPISGWNDSYGYSFGDLADMIEMSPL